MIEIIHTFELYFEYRTLKSFHLAEGPGGFIEAIASLRKNPHDTYYGMTILDDKNDPNIPAWKKTDAFLRNNKNVIIETGADRTGNILSIENFVYCKEKYGSSMEFITADGGFDFSLDFNKQEINIANLIFAQIVYALVMQKKGGSFVLKIFDCFMQHTVDLLFILSSFYDKVYITKPQTSRYANSEKYVVCKGFILPTCQHFFPFLHRAFEKMSMPSVKETFISRFLSIPVSYFFTSRMEEYNAIFGQQQIENIHYTISLIDNKNKQEKIDNLIKMNIQKCVTWCMKYNVLHNVFSPTTTNIFLSTPSGANLRVIEEEEFIETF
jgi:23S rRNA U2552 (ribose-2'-O)-methylase RlmE/FtsJ